MKIVKKIVAIGGGEIGRPGKPIETTKIDKEIISLTGKKSPRVLFIPTASSDSEDYLKVVQKHFGKRLGCKVKVLWLLNSKPTFAEIKKKIFSADIVYVGGGNTKMMLKTWRQLGVDRILRTTWKRGIVLSGVSAGSLCWFRGGASDSLKMIDPKADFIKLKSLGFIPAFHTPHFNEKGRRDGLKRVMKNTQGVAIATDNCCAIEFIDNQYRVLSSKPRARAYKVYWKAGKYHQEVIPQTADLKPLGALLKR